MPWHPMEDQSPHQHARGKRASAPGDRRARAAGPGAARRSGPAGGPRPTAAAGREPRRGPIGRPRGRRSARVRLHGAHHPEAEVVGAGGARVSVAVGHAAQAGRAGPGSAAHRPHGAATIKMVSSAPLSHRAGGVAHPVQGAKAPRAAPGGCPVSPQLVHCGRPEVAQLGCSAPRRSPNWIMLAAPGRVRLGTPSVDYLRRPVTNRMKNANSSTATRAQPMRAMTPPTVAPIPPRRNAC